ncbi:hypothetical protein GCM10022225_48780 [Plantactinospora mayteni]|uniref:CU044_5270 family protein n=1 Tax=Plantactinospora mayteni TaxID=566021 RepID=A0ABQ4ESG6_9ACTN|nr:CU044_5270 family protein [Plantactinospora mayteni]GIG97611.1 hypothetical protein Pma05_41840 [Plantactinospora mayteni]
MKAEEQIRTAFGPADPARDTTIAPPPVTPAQLIARAETAVAGSSRPLLPRRRQILLGGAAVAAAVVTAYALPRGSTGGAHVPSGPDNTAIGQVLLPVAYQFDTNPQPAAAQLRALAGRITDAPYDGRSGRYAYCHDKSWGTSVLSNEGHELRYVEERRRWTAPDGSGRSRLTTLAAEFTSEESRRYWERELPKFGHPPIPNETTTDIPPVAPAPTADPGEAARPTDRTQPPTDPTALATLLRAKYGASHATKWTTELYQRYVVPRQVRAQVLLTLANLDGFLWRGVATDRAGRKGVAISTTMTPPADSGDRNHYEYVLIFDERTGGLLAREATILTPRREPLSYTLILDSSRTDQFG